jgi:hypothetical protein
MSVVVTLSGPFFATTRDLVVRTGINRIEQRVAEVADARVELLHRAFFKHPTPWYWTRPDAVPRADHWVVTDHGVVYGPWLEGTGSRNLTTRFKGYKSFRLAAQSIAGNFPKIVEPAVTDLCQQLNG